MKTLDVLLRTAEQASESSRSAAEELHKKNQAVYKAVRKGESTGSVVKDFILGSRVIDPAEAEKSAPHFEALASLEAGTVVLAKALAEVRTIYGGPGSSLGLRTMPAGQWLFEMAGKPPVLDRKSWKLAFPLARIYSLQQPDPRSLSFQFVGEKEFYITKACGLLERNGSFAVHFEEYSHFGRNERVEISQGDPQLLLAQADNFPNYVPHDRSASPKYLGALLFFQAAGADLSSEQAEYIAFRRRRTFAEYADIASDLCTDGRGHQRALRALEEEAKLLKIELGP